MKSLETIMSEYSIIRMFEDSEFELYQEYTLRNRKRPDFCGFSYRDDGEIKDVLMIELKVDKIDFRSGCGLNFIGTINYLAVPEDIEDFAYRFLENNNKSHVGIISIDKYYNSKITKKHSEISIGYWEHCDENWSFMDELYKTLEEGRLKMDRIRETIENVQQRIQAKITKAMK